MSLMEADSLQIPPMILFLQEADHEGERINTNRPTPDGVVLWAGSIL